MPAKKKFTPAERRGVATIKAKLREEGVIKFYAYQEEDLLAAWRMMMSLQCRQSGKTFGISAEMLLICAMVQRARCVTLSASLRQGALNIQKDAEVWRTVNNLMRKRVGQESALADKDKKLIKSPADDDKGNLLDLDAIADLLEHGKLETKMYWSNAADNYSSHQIFAANPDTARGATVDFLALDEFGTVEEFMEVVRAIKHMIARRPKARFKIKGTPPITSNHASWNLIYDEADYPVNARGNWRQSNAPEGEPFPILRVSAYDAEAAGIQYYNDVTGKPCTVEQYMEASTDKEGDGRELLLQFNSSGNAAVPYSCLVNAQRDLSGGGALFDLGVISDLNELSDESLRAELRRRINPAWVEYCTPGDWIGLGHDQATSDKLGKSNPASFTVMQEKGPFRRTRLCVRWLSRFPRVSDEIMKLIIGDLMRAQMRLRGFGIDASNETFNAQRLAGLFGHLVPVTLYKNGEKHPERDMLWKDYLADQYARHFLDGTATLPANGYGKETTWILTDHSLAVKGPKGIEWRTNKGNHADTFASGMLAGEQLDNGSGPLSVTPVRSSTMHAPPDDFDDEQGFHDAGDSPYENQTLYF